MKHFSAHSAANECDNSAMLLLKAIFRFKKYCTHRKVATDFTFEILNSRALIRSHSQGKSIRINENNDLIMFLASQKQFLQR